MARRVRVTLETPRTLWCSDADAATSAGRTSRGSGSGSGGPHNFSWYDTKRASSSVAPCTSSTAAVVAPPAAAAVAARSDPAAATAAAPAADIAAAAMHPPPTLATVTPGGGKTAPPSRVPSVRVLGIKWKLPVTELLSPEFCWPRGLKELHFWPMFNDALKGVVFPETLEALTFGYWFNKSLGSGCVWWPPRLKRLSFGAKWNRSLVGARASWPASLEVLHFGTGFDKPLQGKDGIGFPPGLQEIDLGGVFNQQLSGVEWPSELRKLTFSEYFNQSLEFHAAGGVGVSFPQGLREISFGSRFDQEVARVAWPKGLETLTFGDGFNRAFASPGLGYSYGDGSTGGRMPTDAIAAAATPLRISPPPSFLLPAGLKVLVLGDGYDHPLRGAELPDGLEKLVIGKSFSFVASVRWPSGLKWLHLSCKWGSNVGGGGGDGGDRPRSSRWLTLPRGLEYLDVGDQFNSPLDSIALPATLKVLNLGSEFDHPIDHQFHVNEKCDARLERHNAQDISQERRRHRGHQDQSQGQENQQGQSSSGLDDAPAPPPPFLPDGLEELRLGAAFNHEIENTRLPNRLKRLLFAAESKFDRPVAGVEWPMGLEELRFGNYFDQPMVGTSGNGHFDGNLSDSGGGLFGGGSGIFTSKILPAMLRELHFGWAFSHSLQGLELPQGLRHLSFSRQYPLSHVRGLEWPDSLRSIYVGAFPFGNRMDVAKWPSQPPF